MIGALARIADVALHPVEMRAAHLGQQPKSPLGMLDEFLDFVAGAGENDVWSGAAVTKQTALNHAAVWACINIRSSVLAQLPIHVYQVDPDGSKYQLRAHYLWHLLNRQVNDYLTPFRFKQLTETSLCLDGNAYAQIVVNGRGQVTEIWPWHYSRVKVDFSNKEVGPIYVYKSETGEEVREPWFNMLHFRGIGTDGYSGLSPITYHRQTIGLGLSQKEYTARFYGNSAVPGGALEFPMSFASKKETVDRIRKSWEETHGTAARAHRIALLEEGIKFHEISPMKMVDAQYIESAGLNIDDICRIFNVPPHMVFQLLRMTNNNIEWQGMEWLTYRLGPILKNWEEELTRILLSDREAETIQIEFVRNALMQMDSRARSAYYGQAITYGWMNQNDAARLENLNPHEGGDVYHRPSTLVPIGTPIAATAPRATQ